MFPALTPNYIGEVGSDPKVSNVWFVRVYDNNAKCCPPGMPAMMNMAYGMEVMQTRDKITFFSELNDALRRVYLDGRKPTQSTWTTRRMRDTRLATGKGTRSSSKRSRCTLIRSSRASLPIAIGLGGSGAYSPGQSRIDRRPHYRDQSESADQTVGHGSVLTGRLARGTAGCERVRLR